MSKLKLEKIYYILFISYIINQILSESQFINISDIAVFLFITRYVVLFLLIILIFYNYKTENKIKFFLLNILSLFMVLNLIIADGGLSFLPIVLFVVGAKGYSLEKLFKYTIYTLISTHILVMLSVCLGIVQDTIDVRYIGDYAGSFFGGVYYRHNMGFLVHNQIALTFLIVYLLIIALKRENIKFHENLILMALNYCIFVFFGSRIVFILTILTCVFYYLVKLSIYVKFKKVSKFWCLSYPILMIFSFVAAISYSSDNVIWRTLDLLFNNRLRLAHEAIDYFGVGIIGSGQYAGTYNSLELTNNTVDNGYIAVSLQNGIIVAIIMIGIWMYIMYVFSKKNNKYLTLVLIIMAIENIINAHIGSYKLLPFFCILANQDDYFLDKNFKFHSIYKKFKCIRFSFGGYR